ncbi:hypothetical protein Ocin01_04822 [Orchesella cincta]|uniref:Uncharacterized protein n=1 Tax=Orchesella cincta TaxID=48709 RepID=A0A1D2N9V7_ORCCI|nr:hypothetical protein Ocin01_04822 [Orchesella cincta]
MLFKQHLLKFFGVLILIQLCAVVTGNDEDKGRSPVSTMMKQGGKNRRPENPIRGRPCKRPKPKPVKNKNGTTKRNDDATEGRFFPGPFGWDISKFPIRLRPEKHEEPCDDDSLDSRGGDHPVDDGRPLRPHQNMHDTLEEAKCRVLLESIKNKPVERPKPGEKKNPEMWGWDVGLVLRTQESSPRRRMREHNKRVQIHRCKKRQNKNKSSSKPHRQWMAPDYAQVAQAMSEGQGGEMGDDGGASGRRIEIDPGFNIGSNRGSGMDIDPGFNIGSHRGSNRGSGIDIDPGFNIGSHRGSNRGSGIDIDPGFNIGSGIDIDPGFNRPGLTGRNIDPNFDRVPGNGIAIDPGFNIGSGGGTKVRPRYAIPSTLPAESFSDGGTAHAGTNGITSLVDRIAPELVSPHSDFCHGQKYLEIDL